MILGGEMKYVNENYANKNSLGNFQKSLPMENI